MFEQPPASDPFMDSGMAPAPQGGDPFMDAGPPAPMMDSGPPMGMPAPAAAVAPVIPEMTKLREWEQAHSLELQEKEDKEIAEKRALKAAAAEDLGSKKPVWERVVDLIDTNARAADAVTDISRMRGLLIQLKSQPPVGC